MVAGRACGTDAAPGDCRGPPACTRYQASFHSRCSAGLAPSAMTIRSRTSDGTSVCPVTYRCSVERGIRTSRVRSSRLTLAFNVPAAARARNRSSSPASSARSCTRPGLGPKPCCLVNIKPPGSAFSQAPDDRLFAYTRTYTSQCTSQIVTPIGCVRVSFASVGSDHDQNSVTLGSARETSHSRAGGDRDRTRFRAAPATHGQDAARRARVARQRFRTGRPDHRRSVGRVSSTVGAGQPARVRQRAAQAPAVREEERAAHRDRHRRLPPHRHA